MTDSNPQSKIPTAAILAEIQALVSGYWYEVDFNESRELSRFFTEDCSYAGGSNIRYQGRAGIDAFYADAHSVREVPERTVRHSITNLHVIEADEREARVYYLCTTYGSAGSLPLAGLIVPSQITDIRLRCLREADGAWRIRDFRGEPVFISPHSLIWKQAGWDSEGSPASLQHQWPRPLGPTSLESGAE